MAYPPSKYNISFVPAGNSATVRKIAEQVNALLTESITFQQYFSIVDGDIERLESDPTKGRRLFHLPISCGEPINEDEILEVNRMQTQADLESKNVITLSYTSCSFVK